MIAPIEALQVRLPLRPQIQPLQLPILPPIPHQLHKLDRPSPIARILRHARIRRALIVVVTRRTLLQERAAKLRQRHDGLNPFLFGGGGGLDGAEPAFARFGDDVGEVFGLFAGNVEEVGGEGGLDDL